MWREVGHEKGRCLREYTVFGQLAVCIVRRFCGRVDMIVTRIAFLNFLSINVSLPWVLAILLSLLSSFEAEISRFHSWTTTWSRGFKLEEVIMLNHASALLGPSRTRFSEVVWMSFTWEHYRAMRSISGHYTYHNISASLLITWWYYPECIQLSTFLLFLSDLRQLWIWRDVSEMWTIWQCSHQTGLGPHSASYLNHLVVVHNGSIILSPLKTVSQVL